ncbi:SPOSA6832_00389 [Sporobolomyces salmonicolor]|uniref:SPOSA6832_00389-mRNA-1:cds n=1 Tax=Sporidiobolus salmonicolor TaxID=5005 RepID=A0A0D6EH59_SPOSA|nr:SPOSA6832_00389 [Sporobolomyces salmonicolor]
MSSLLYGARGFIRSFFTSSSASAEQLQTAKETVEVLELDHEAQGSAIQQYLAQRAGVSKVTVPQIFIKGEPVGGCSDLKQLQAAGKLDKLLA